MKFAGSGVSIKMLSVLTAFCDKPVSVLGRAVMALLFFIVFWKLHKLSAKLTLKVKNKRYICNKNWCP